MSNSREVLRSWADSAEFSTPAWGTPRCPESPRVWVRDNGSWRLWVASPGSSGRSEASRGQQTGRQPRDHWGQSWRPGYGPASERRHYCHHHPDLFSADQNAVLDGPRRDPVKHSCAVILHLRLNKVKIPGLILSININNNIFLLFIIDFACSSAIPTSILPSPSWSRSEETAWGLKWEIQNFCVYQKQADIKGVIIF